jgi:hypothetical protein
MKLFRLYLAVVLIAVIVYTWITVQNYGWGLFPVFIGDIMKINWSGQFNLDFMCMLTFSGLWVSWRNRFSLAGILLGLLAFVGGTLFLASYLIYLSIEAKGDLKKVLIG